MAKGVMYSEDLDRGDVLTGAARVQQLREKERDRIKLEREVKNAIDAEFKMKEEKKKAKKKKKKKKKKKGIQNDPEC
jgi:hypothetical protein